jgi:hypothetical protein
MQASKRRLTQDLAQSIVNEIRASGFDKEDPNHIMLVPTVANAMVELDLPFAYYVACLILARFVDESIKENRTQVEVWDRIRETVDNAPRR